MGRAAVRVMSPLDCLKFRVRSAVLLKQQEPSPNMDAKGVIIERTELYLLKSKRVVAARPSSHGVC